MEEWKEICKDCDFLEECQSKRTARECAVFLAKKTTEIITEMEEKGLI